RQGTLLLLVSLAGWCCCLLVASARLRGLLINSTLLAGGALLISAPIGSLLAIAIAKTSLWGRRWLEGLLIVWLFVPLYVQATAWQATVGQGGWLVDQSWLTGWGGAIWIHGIAAIPWVVLFVAATLRKVPRELEEESLQDVAAWKVLVSVSLRQASAGIVAASLWVAVICFSEITVTDLFQVRTFAEEIYTAASLGTLDGGAIESAVRPIDQAEVPQFVSSQLWLGTLAIVFLVVAALAAIWIWVPVANFISPTVHWIWEPRRGRWLVSIAPWLLAIVVVGLPLLGLLGKAGAVIVPSNGIAVQTWSPTKAAQLIAASPWEHRREFGWSLTIGAVAAVSATAIAVVIAWSLRTSRLPTLPTALALAWGFAVPGPLLGVWIIRWLNHPTDSILAPLTWCYDHTILAPVLAQLLRALPLATLIVGTQFTSIPQGVLDSAKSEGAGWWQRLFQVALPWCWPAVAAASCMALIVALGDLAATLLVAPPGVSPLSVRIFGLLHYGAEDRVSALCLMLIVLLAVVVTLAWRAPALLDRSSNHD
ncbi:MAG: ABC transporter permease, partial [Bythopirellula sp.]